MKPRVVASLNDDTGMRCVDILEFGGGFGFVECRRDPEDGHGWRRLSEPLGGFASPEAARIAAADHTGWSTP
ncbi:hypothetical protein [Oceaniglobus roseus]|uniref:hypothetical protein n=1 Tax=Oceaniglobus roseus TaxID=1737570 RepID=UPI000C7F067F|nr:hypothetical protein [Kandeliimicrobium roseum]